MKNWRRIEFVADADCSYLVHLLYMNYLNKLRENERVAYFKMQRRFNAKYS